MKIITIPVVNALACLFFFSISCQKELSATTEATINSLRQSDSAISFLNRADEKDNFVLTDDTTIAVINLPLNGLYDMDFYSFEGPATITVVNYDITKWPCPLLLKEYNQANGGVPVQLSFNNKITVNTVGTGTVAVQKADESCQGIVPYKIVKNH